MKKLNYKFKDETLLKLALTQSGANAANNNERLEFLGDRVLGLSVASLLYEMFPAEAEGALAQRHAALVSSDTLADIAKDFGIDKKIKHGHMTGGKLKHVSADAVESILGAVYLDGGYAAAEKIIRKIWTELAAREITPPKDSKTALQELVQRRDSGLLPEYKLIESGGPSHSPVFRVSVNALGQSAVGSGTSKKAASTAAASALLEILSTKSSPP